MDETTCVNLKNHYVEQKEPKKRLYTTLFHSCKVQEKCKLTYSDKK